MTFKILIIRAVKLMQSQKATYFYTQKRDKNEILNNDAVTHSSSVTLLLNKFWAGHSSCCLFPDLFFRMKCKNFIEVNNK